MKTEQRTWTKARGWTILSDRNLKDSAQLVFAFGSTAVLADSSHYEEVKAFYPSAHIVMCSTAGEIIDRNVVDDSVSITALHFDTTTIAVAHVDIAEASQSREVGKKVASMIPTDGLVHALVFSD